MALEDKAVRLEVFAGLATAVTLDLKGRLELLADAEDSATARTIQAPSSMLRADSPVFENGQN